METRVKKKMFEQHCRSTQAYGRHKRLRNEYTKKRGDAETTFEREAIGKSTEKAKSFSYINLITSIKKTEYIAQWMRGRGYDDEEKYGKFLTFKFVFN